MPEGNLPAGRNKDKISWAAAQAAARRGRRSAWRALKRRCTLLMT
jgi:hypothetical protein